MWSTPLRLATASYDQIDAGGEFIVTQLFYDCGKFIKFVADCREIGITCPIIPGIMPIMTYGGFKRMTGFCKTYVPQEILDTLEPIKDNDQAVKVTSLHALLNCRSHWLAGSK